MKHIHWNKHRIHPLAIAILILVAVFAVTKIYEYRRLIALLPSALSKPEPSPVLIVDAAPIPYATITTYPHIANHPFQSTLKNLLTRDTRVKMCRWERLAQTQDASFLTAVLKTNGVKLRLDGYIYKEGVESAHVSMIGTMTDLTAWDTSVGGTGKSITLTSQVIDLYSSNAVTRVDTELPQLHEYFQEGTFWCGPWKEEALAFEYIR